MHNMYIHVCNMHVCDTFVHSSGGKQVGGVSTKVLYCINTQVELYDCVCELQTLTIYACTLLYTCMDH